MYPRVNFIIAAAVATTACTAVVLSIPFWDNVYGLLSMFLLQGLFLGFVESGDNLFLLHLWGTEVMPFFQSAYLTYSIGSFVAPLIASPFLVHSNSSADHNITTIDFYQQKEDLQLVFPYGIVSCILAGVIILCLIIYSCCPETGEHPSRRMRGRTVLKSSPSTESGDSWDSNDIHEPRVLTKGTGKSIRFWRIVVSLLSFLMEFVHKGLALCFNSFLVPFAVHSGLNLSKSTGVHLTTLYWVTYTLAKVLSIGYISRIGNRLNLVACFTSIVAATLILTLLGGVHESCLWLGVGVMGFGVANVYTGLIGFLEDYFRVSSLVGSMMVVFAELASFVFPLILSHSMEHNSDILFHVVLFCASADTVLFLLILVICETKLKRNNS